MTSEPQDMVLTFDVLTPKLPCLTRKYENRTTRYGARIRCFDLQTVISHSIYPPYV